MLSSLLPSVRHDTSVSWCGVSQTVWSDPALKQTCVQDLVPYVRVSSQLTDVLTCANHVATAMSSILGVRSLSPGPSSFTTPLCNAQFQVDVKSSRRSTSVKRMQPYVWHEIPSLRIQSDNARQITGISVICSTQVLQPRCKPVAISLGVSATPQFPVCFRNRTTVGTTVVGIPPDPGSACCQ